MSDVNPSRLGIPLRCGNTCEHSVHDHLCKDQFTEKVLKYSPGISEFAVHSDKKTMGEIKRNWFSVSVDGSQYKVYPNVSSIASDQNTDYIHPEKVRAYLDENASIKLPQA